MKYHRVTKNTLIGMLVANISPNENINPNNADIDQKFI